MHYRFGLYYREGLHLTASECDKLRKSLAGHILLVHKLLGLIGEGVWA